MHRQVGFHISKQWKRKILKKRTNCMYLSDHFSPGRLLPQKCFTTPSELRKVLFLTPSVCGIFLFLDEYLGNCWTDMRQIHTVPRSDEFEGQGQQGQKTAFLALSEACVQFMFGKTSLASSLFINFFWKRTFALTSTRSQHWTTFPSPNQPCQSTAGNSKHWPQPVTWSQSQSFSRLLKEGLISWFHWPNYNMIRQSLVPWFPTRDSGLERKLGPLTGKLELMAYWSFGRASWSNSNRCLAEPKSQRCTDLTRCIGEMTYMANFNHE